jgi:hypothetical protein
MGKIGKTSALLLTLTILMSCLTLLIVKPVDAQTIPKPSVPEFSLKYVDRSYDIPTTTIATTTTDPYNGKTTTTYTTKEGYHVGNHTVEFTIKNQPYVKNENASELFYNFRFKGNYQNESYWKTEPPPSGNFGIYYQASNGAETVISLSLEQMASDYYMTTPAIPDGGQIDFQVQALVGHNVHLDTAVAFDGERSDWSSLQTVTIPATHTSPIPTPTVPEFPVLVIVPLLLSLFSIVLVVRHRKTANLHQCFFP